MNRVDPTSTRASLWFAFLAGPLAWTAHELVSYVLVKVACGSAFSGVEHVVTLAALAVAAAGAYVGIRVHGGQTRAPQTTSEFVAGAGILISGVFAFAILMEAIPNAVVNPCL